MTFDPAIERKLQQGFKYLNYFMLLLWRLGLGWMLNSYPPTFGRYLVITHTGRKSGKRRRTPLNYAEVDGELYIVAGFGKKADWYHNIAANPQVEIWLKDGWYAGVAEDISDGPEKVKLMRPVLIGSGFVASLFGLNIKKMSDEELGEMCASYRLFHLKRTAPITGRGGPGDLAWVWQIATLYLLLARCRGKKRK
jgi:deazaflavin-dependent oxidoreductase (nitroreductase family)